MVAQGVTNAIRQAAMVPSALIGLFGGAAYFGTLDADPMKPIMVCTLFYHSHCPCLHASRVGY